jgi:nucleotide-binding universal stress UspA family protein
MIEMKEFQHLVVAFDGTEDSKEALELGIHISKQFHSELSVVHIQKKGIFNGDSIEDNMVFPGTNSSYQTDDMRHYPIMPVPTEHVETEEHSKETQALESEARRILDHHNIKGNVNVTYGEPSEAIVSFATEHNADLIVVGSRDISGLKRLLFGSVSEKVSHRSNIPVLIAK